MLSLGYYSHQEVLNPVLARSIAHKQLSQLRLCPLLASFHFMNIRCDEHETVRHSIDIFSPVNQNCASRSYVCLPAQTRVQVRCCSGEAARTQPTALLRRLRRSQHAADDQRHPGSLGPGYEPAYTCLSRPFQFLHPFCSALSPQLLIVYHVTRPEIGHYNIFDSTAMSYAAPRRGQVSTLCTRGRI